MDNNKLNKKLSKNLKLHTFGKTKELGRILGKEGTLEILNLLDERPRQYTELETSVKLSHTSLLRRLKMLQNLGIAKKELIRSKSRKTHSYNLTLRGDELLRFIKSYEKEMALPPSQQNVIEIKKLMTH